MNSRILFNIELPPPMHGMTYINKIIYDNLKENKNYKFFDANFTSHVGEVGGFSFRKVLRNITVIFDAWKSFIKFKPDRVYTILSASKFGIVRDAILNLPAIVLQKELIVHLHGFTYYKIYQDSAFYKILFDVIAKNAKIIVLCEKQKQKTYQVMNKNSIVLYNCLNTKENNSIPKHNKILQVCYISNISKQKGTFDLVKAIQLYPNNIKLVIAGNFLSDKVEFLELIKDSENISYVGFADEATKKNILKTSNIFCLPSKLEEGSPVSIIEAMSYGLPVIATDKGCVKEMIGDGGYLLESEYSYLDIIDGIMTIEGDLNMFSRKSFDNYSRKYSQKSFIQKFKEILN